MCSLVQSAVRAECMRGLTSLAGKGGHNDMYGHEIMIVQLWQENIKGKKKWSLDLLLRELCALICRAKS